MVCFEFKLVIMDVVISQFIFDFDGQQLIYDYGFSCLVVMQWLSVNGFGVVCLIVMLLFSSGCFGLILEGFWVWFCLFDQLDLECGNLLDCFILWLCIDGFSIVCELCVSSVFNFFKSWVVFGFSFLECF